MGIYDNFYNDKEVSRDINLMEKSELERCLNDENFKTEFVNKRKEKLKNIDLIEKNYEELYGWKSLLSKNRPLSCYTHKKTIGENNKYKNYNNNEEKNKIENDLEHNTQEDFDIENDEARPKEFNEKNLSANLTTRKKYKHPFRDDPIIENEKINNSFREKSEKKKDKSDFIFPIALIDETEDKLYEFITIPKNISERRKKMEYFIHIQSQSQRKTGKSNKKSSTKRKRESAKRLSVSVNSSIHNNPNYKDEMIQASSSVLQKNIHFNKTFTKEMHNSSRISQSVIRNRKKSNPGKNMAPRPMSVYAKRSENAVYYMSKEFSDYFKQDLKEFSEKFSLLHPKIKCDTTKIKKLLEEVKLLQDEDEKLLKNFKIDNDAFDIRDLNLAGNSKNIYPLLKSFLKNYYPEDEVNKFFKDKIYPISNRPLGNRVLGINNKNNVRSKNFEEQMNYNNRINNEDDKLNIKTYDINDPDLQIFFDKTNSIVSEERGKVELEDNSSKGIELKENNKIYDYGVVAMANSISPQSVNSCISNELVEKNNKSICEEAAFDLIIPKNEVFREKKLSSRPKTAMNKKNFVINSIINIYIFNFINLLSRIA